MGCTKLPGLHQLLGWHLAIDTINFISMTIAEFDITNITLRRTLYCYFTIQKSTIERGGAYVKT